MADLQLSRAEAQSGRLPALCMQCGEQASDEVVKKYSTHRVHPPPPLDEPVGCLILGPIFALLNLVSWSASKSMSVRTPLCHKHAHGWFVRSTLHEKSISDESIVLAGVSEKFVQAWEKQRAAEPKPASGPIKIRCRNCRALNDEAAKFCNQCGDAL